MRWTLSELADFETLLKKTEVTDEHRQKVAKTLEEASQKSETGKRRLALKKWYDIIKEDGVESKAGDNLSVAFRTIQAISFFISIILGIALIAGLIEKVGMTEGKAYNIWKLLAIPVGAQWVFIIISILSWLILRNNSRKLTLIEELIGQLVKRLSGKAGQQGWNDLYRSSNSYRSILSWKVAGITQWGAIGFNLGLIGGFYCILLFIEINFFWATSIDGFGLSQLDSLTNLISLPWTLLNLDWNPDQAQLIVTQLQIGELNPEGKPQYWYPFILASLVVYGLIPRVILLIVCNTLKKRSLNKLSFMEKRHRELWRKLRLKSVSEDHYSEPEDSVVIINIGGIEISEAQLRPFLLQKLRVNAIATFKAGVLNKDEKEDALTSLSKAKRGVVFLVESWSLSPKQLQALHKQVRELIPTQPIHFLILGLPKNGIYQAPQDTELSEWKSFISNLNDPESEITPYNNLDLR